MAAISVIAVCSGSSVTIRPNVRALQPTTQHLGHFAHNGFRFGPDLHLKRRDDVKIIISYRLSEPTKIAVFLISRAHQPILMILQAEFSVRLSSISSIAIVDIEYDKLIKHLERLYLHSKIC